MATSDPTSSSPPSGYNWSPFPGKPGVFIAPDPSNPSQQIEWHPDGQLSVSDPGAGTFGGQASTLAGADQNEAQGVGGSFGSGSGSGSGSSLTNALQPQYSPTPPTSTAAQVDPTSQIQEILSAFAPQAKQQSMTLNDSLAAAGITGGGTVGAQQQLAGQQSSSLGSALSGAIENANDLNANSLNSNNQFNTSNLINTENGNVSTANNFEQFLASLQNSDWSQQLGAYTGLQQSGLSGQQGINQASTQNYANPQGTASGISSLTGALGNYYGQSTPTATPETPTFSTAVNDTY